VSTDRGHWTPLPVAERLAEAADALERLPQGGVQGYASRLRWPYADAGRSGARLPSPSPEAIDRMDEALGWLMWLEPGERRLVWLRAEGVPWKRITQRLGIGRTTAWQRWTIALLKISVRLNAAAEQNHSDIKPLNRSEESVLPTP
jgi:Domain of unknown function (DUF6362)